MNQIIQSSPPSRRVRYQVQARRVEREDEASWFDMEEVRPMSRKAVDLQRNLTHFAA